METSSPTTRSPTMRSPATSSPTMVTARRAESTARVVWEMVVPTVRTLACAPAVVVVVAVAATVAVAEIRPPDVPNLAPLIRLSTLMLAIGAGFSLDDGASETLAAVPFSLLRRRLVRVGMGLAVIAPAWAGLLLYARARDVSVPAVAFTVELTGLIAVALAFASVLIRMGRPTPGAFVMPAMLIFRQLTAAVPAKWGLWGGSPGDLVWDQSHRRWVAVAVLALMLAGWFAHDPARRKLFRGAQGGHSTRGGVR